MKLVIVESPAKVPMPLVQSAIAASRILDPRCYCVGIGTKTIEII